jgi:tetratricopeptide (TPR) repeat protein
MWMLAFVTLAAQSGAQWASIPDSLFQPITLPQTLSFGYPPNTIYVPTILDMARRRDFDGLDAMFNELAADVAGDVRHEMRFEDAFDAFARDEPALLASLDAWVDARPNSAHARVARARYHFATAWRRRGGAYIRDTPLDNIRGMEVFSKKTIEDLTAALVRDSTHLAAYVILIGVTQLFGAHDLAGSALQRAASIHRGAYSVYRSFVLMLWPRWGGSEALMIDFGNRAAEDSATNPRLATLRGAVYQSRAFDSSQAGDHAGAVRELNKALAFGPERTYLRDRGKAYFRLGAYEYAFHDLRAAMVERSQDPEVLEYYGRTLVELAANARL